MRKIIRLIGLIYIVFSIISQYNLLRCFFVFEILPFYMFFAVEVDQLVLFVLGLWLIFGKF